MASEDSKKSANRIASGIGQALSGVGNSLFNLKEIQQKQELIENKKQETEIARQQAEANLKMRKFSLGVKTLQLIDGTQGKMRENYVNSTFDQLQNYLGVPLSREALIYDERGGHLNTLTNALNPEFASMTDMNKVSQSASYLSGGNPQVAAAIVKTVTAIKQEAKKREAEQKLTNLTPEELEVAREQGFQASPNQTLDPENPNIELSTPSPKAPGGSALALPKFLTQQIDNFQDKNKSLFDQRDSLRNMRGILNQENINETEFGSLLTMTSKAAGETRITDQDIDRIKPGQSVYQRFKSMVAKGVTGKPTKEQIQILRDMQAGIQAKHDEAFSEAISSYANRAKAIPNISKEEFEQQLRAELNAPKPEPKKEFNIKTADDMSLVQEVQKNRAIYRDPKQPREARKKAKERGRQLMEEVNRRKAERQKQRAEVADQKSAIRNSGRQ